MKKQLLTIDSITLIKWYRVKGVVNRQIWINSKRFLTIYGPQRLHDLHATSLNWNPWLVPIFLFIIYWKHKKWAISQVFRLRWQNQLIFKSSKRVTNTHAPKHFSLWLKWLQVVSRKSYTYRVSSLQFCRTIISKRFNMSKRCDVLGVYVCLCVYVSMDKRMCAFPLAMGHLEKIDKKMEIKNFVLNLVSWVFFTW